MHIDELKNAGLSENEAKVYMAALELGETSVYRLAKKSGVKRTTTYLAVENLKEKGLMSEYHRNNVIICYAENPKKLAEMLENKKRALDKILPELLAFNNLIDKKPKIRYFEGKESYKDVFGDVLKYPDNEMLGTFNEKFWNYGNYFTEYFIPKRKEKKIWARILFQDNPELRGVAQNEKEHFFQSKLVLSDKFKVEIEMVIYGNNKVGLVSYDEEIAIIIESQKIHDTQKSFFEVIWDLTVRSCVVF
ncbi:MAG: Transcriptional regulator, TrmB [Patescibacteria group bacterium]|nr:Transcriptional regulator, TrmB [Patescibacteria group bacterium]